MTIEIKKQGSLTLPRPDGHYATESSSNSASSWRSAWVRATLPLLDWWALYFEIKALSRPACSEVCFMGIKNIIFTTFRKKQRDYSSEGFGLSVPGFGSFGSFSKFLFIKI